MLFGYSCNQHVLSDLIMGCQPRELLLCLLLVEEDTPFAPPVADNFQIISGLLVFNPRKDYQVLACISLRSYLQVHRLC